jgi:hypothetical protein
MAVFHERPPHREVRKHRHCSPSPNDVHITASPEINEVDPHSVWHDETVEPTGEALKATPMGHVKLPWPIVGHG